MIGTNTFNSTTRAALDYEMEVTPTNSTTKPFGPRKCGTGLRRKIQPTSAVHPAGRNVTLEELVETYLKLLFDLMGTR